MRKVKSIIAILLTVILLLTIATGCKNEDNEKRMAEISTIVSKAKNETYNEIKNLNEERGVPTNLKEIDLESIESIPVEARSGIDRIKINPGYERQYYRKVLGINPSGMRSFNTDNKFYPGSVLALADPTNIASVSFLGCPLDKVTLTHRVEGAVGLSDPTVVTVPNTLADVVKGINKIYSTDYNKGNEFQLAVTIKPSIIRSEADLQAALGFIGDANDSSKLDQQGFKYSGETGETITAVVAVNQQYGNIMVSYPGDTSKFFSKDLTPETLERKLKEINSTGDNRLAAPLYVSNVVYGRTGYIMITVNSSNISERALLSYLSKTINSKTFNDEQKASNIDSDFEKFRIKNEATIETFIYGGGVSGNTDLIQCNTVGDMRQMLTNFDATKIAAYPLEYTLSYLDGAKFGIVPLNVEYGEKCVKIPVTKIIYDGITTIGANRPVDLAKSSLECAPNTAVLGQLQYDVLSENARMQGNAVVLLTNAKVGDNVAVKITTVDEGVSLIVNFEIIK